MSPAEFFIGFFLCYYSFVALFIIYAAIVEEWCCKNPFPGWYDKYYYRNLENDSTKEIEI